MIWAIIFGSLGLVGCVLVIVLAVSVHRKQRRFAEEARRLAMHADEARKLLTRLETRTGD